MTPTLRPLHVKGPVVIGNNVWIGEGVRILSGVTIGDGAIIGANAFVDYRKPMFKSRILYTLSLTEFIISRIILF